MSGDSGSTPPPKPWERVGGSSGPTPFKPSSPGNTSHVIEASGTAKPGEIVSTSEGNSRVQTNALGRPVPSRPWEQTYGNNYGGYNSGSTYNSGYGYGSGMYGSSGAYGGYGGLYGGNNMYNRGYGGGVYGSSGLYGGGMYNSNFGSPMGGYGGMGMGGPYGDQDPNNPFASPSSPPGFWVSFLRVMHGVVTFFGRIAMLIDQNTQAFHIFISALLQLFDRSGLLYGELARFVLRLLGIRTKAKKQNQLAPSTDASVQLEAPKVASGSWDNVWANDSAAKRE